MIKSLKELRYHLGLSLSIIGVTIGMLLNYFFPVVKWSPIVMSLSILLLLDKNIFVKSLKPNKFLVAIVFFQLFMILCSIVSDYSSPVFNKYLSYHLYIIAIAVVFAKNSDLRQINFLTSLFVVSSFIAIIAAVIAYFDLVRMDILLRKDEAVLELFTLNITSYANLLSGICLFRNKKIFFKLAIIFFILIDFYVVVKSGKRSFFAAIFMSIFIYMYKYKCIVRGFLCGVSLFIVLFIAMPQVRDSTIGMFSRSLDGIATVFINKNKKYDFDKNDSAVIRRYNKQKIFDDLEERYTVLNIITGMGYYYAYIDNPLLESFLDMGIIGLIFYVYIVIVVPILYFRKVKGGDDFSLFLLLNSMMNITIILTNNNPYQYFVYTPICLMAMRYDELNNVRNKLLLRKLIIKKIISVRLKLKTVDLCL